MEKHICSIKIVPLKVLGLVVQSISLKSLLRGHLLSVLQLNNQIYQYFVEKMKEAFEMQKLLTFCQQKYDIRVFEILTLESLM